ncbi:MAG: hypothetical protein JWM76_1683 [Pseudonocardiales bacterium]|nr:hypothetical protein [Pseudonocardiales bacterium]
MTSADPPFEIAPTIGPADEQFILNLRVSELGGRQLEHEHEHEHEHAGWFRFANHLATVSSWRAGYAKFWFIA